MSTNIIAAPAVASPSTTTMTRQRLLRAYFIEAKLEFIRTLRNPSFGIPSLVLPVVLFMIFGALAQGAGDTPETRMQLFSGMAILGIMGPGLFSFGAMLAAERQYRLLDFKRALPMPPGSHLVAKMANALIYASLVITSMLVVATSTGRVSLTFAQSLNIGALLMLGVLPFCAIGFFIGSRASTGGGNGMTTLVYLPMLYFSGLFFPLPGLLKIVALVMPPFYLKQLVLAAGGVNHTFIGNAAVHVIVLLGLTVLLTGLAARRLQRG